MDHLRTSQGLDGQPLRTCVVKVSVTDN